MAAETPVEPEIGSEHAEHIARLIVVRTLLPRVQLSQSIETSPFTW